MLKILSNPAQIVTVDTKGKNYKRGVELSDIGVITGHSVVVENGLIKDIIPNSSVSKISSQEIISTDDKIVLPGLVECHTHSVFAGSRSDEFRMRLQGKSYEEIAAAGGGINSTVKAVRSSSGGDLFNLAESRVWNFIKQGVTALEIKSGYGLDFDNEIKILNVINKLKSLFPIDVISTFLGAHTIPPEFRSNRKGYLELLTKKMIPYVAENKLAEFCDGFCESTAFSSDEIGEIFSAASSNGLRLKLHTEQFNNIGGLETAVSRNAVSVDHLEVITNGDIGKVASSDTTAVLLPGVSFFLGYDYAPARSLIDSGAIVALATDFNPGSSHINNINMIMCLAALNMKLSIEEIISAYTINAAKAVCREDRIGSIEIGKKADFAVFDAREYSDIIYNAGNNLNIMTIKNGEIIYKSPSLD